MILNALSLVMSILVLRMHHYESCVQRPMRPWQRYLFLQVIPAFLRVPLPREELPLSIFSSDTWKFSKDKEEDPVQQLLKRSETVVPKTVGHCTCLPDSKHMCKCKPDPEKTNREVAMAIKQLIGQTLDTVRKINQKASNSDMLEEEMIIGAREEWVFAAFIVDRCLLVVFVLYLIVILIKYGVPLLWDSVLVIPK